MANTFWELLPEKKKKKTVLEVIPLYALTVLPSQLKQQLLPWSGLTKAYTHFSTTLLISLLYLQLSHGVSLYHITVSIKLHLCFSSIASQQKGNLQLRALYKRIRAMSWHGCELGQCLSPVPSPLLQSRPAAGSSQQSLGTPNSDYVLQSHLTPNWPLIQSLN